MNAIQPGRQITVSEKCSHWELHTRIHHTNGTLAGEPRREGVPDCWPKFLKLSCLCLGLLPETGAEPASGVWSEEGAARG